MSDLAFETRAARAGVARPPLLQVASVPPLHPSVTWLLPTQQALEAALSEGNAFVYARNANPTVALFEEAVGDLEGGEAVAFASGQAAMHAALLSLDLRPGDHVAIARDCYGMTRTLLLELSASAGVRPLTVTASEPEQVAAALQRREQVRALVVEAIANPLVRVADLPALAAIAHRHGAALVVDATLATPLLVRPLEYGADLVVHSATKFLVGHGDVVAGVVCGRGERLAPVRRLAQVVGGVLGPFEAWLALRGLRTLALRLERQCQNAALLARWLAEQPTIARVHYPGLPDHPDYALARRLFGGERFGAVVSFELARAGRAEVERFLDRLQLCLPATTLGDLFSELSYPAIASHRTLTVQERQAAGISEALVRLSVGIEAVADVTADLAQALEGVHER
ncbi:MAG: PLP-dependent aspartate aminotransferase family protein [Chloroflexi bacterium]|nr:PLP-dependent aspartate aminotransferase family protein [Chloroflexota bacterium]